MDKRKQREKIPRRALAFRVNVDRYDKYVDAALRDGFLNLSPWIRKVLDEAERKGRER